MEEKITLFVPGRLCLFGEHSDWAGIHRMMNAHIEPGMAIVTGIEQGIYAEAVRSDHFEVTSSAPELASIWTDFSSPMVVETLRATAGSGSFFAHSAGVASYMRENYDVGGVRIHLTRMTLPMKKGLSSSAAICVLIARAFNLLYGLNLNTQTEMEIAFLGEQRTPSRCGRLDQACAFGVRPVQMEFDGDEIDVKPLSVQGKFHYVFADLGAGKDTVKILADLSSAYPFPRNEKERRIHEALGVENRRLTSKAVELLKEGDREGLGALMTEAQRIFDEKVAPMSPEELASPVLHRTLADETIRSLTFGGKGVGSQGDGSVQFLARDEASQRELVDYLKSIGMTPYSLTLGPTRQVRKAVIPVAGHGTRLYPAARAVRKEFFPVVDSDGLAKPAILILLEQLIESQIEEICLVVADETDRQLYEDFFLSPLPENVSRKLPVKIREYQRKIQKIGRRLTFVYQREQRGFGHAVFQSLSFAQNEPVLLLLCDTLYQSRTMKTCSSQLIEVFERYNRPMIAIHKIPLGEVDRYGVLAGVWENREKTVMNLESIVEKPSPDYAEEYLATPGANGENEYYSVFGQYIITPEIYAELEKRIAESDRRESSERSGSDFSPSKGSGEIELTSVLEAVRRQGGMLGVVLDGEMFDIGIPSVYRQTVTRFGAQTPSRPE